MNEKSTNQPTESGEYKVITNEDWENMVYHLMDLVPEKREYIVERIGPLRDEIQSLTQQLEEAKKLIQAYEKGKVKLINELKKENERLKREIEQLARFCESRNKIQLDGNEFAPSFINRIRQLTKP